MIAIETEYFIMNFEKTSEVIFLQQECQVSSVW